MFVQKLNIISLFIKMFFKKKYDIPFLLVEFKGEYIFLQEVIDDLIIIRPGENFSLYYEMKEKFEKKYSHRIKENLDK